MVYKFDLDNYMLHKAEAKQAKRIVYRDTAR